jgi:hypothetical protein
MAAIALPLLLPCSLLLAICRWCNLSQLLHTAEQQGAPRSAAAFRELFQQAWCHAAVFLLANYTAVLVALLRREVEQQQQLLSPAPARSPLQQQQRATSASSLLQQGLQDSTSQPPPQQQQQQVEEQLHALSLDAPALQQQQQQQQQQEVMRSPSASSASRGAARSLQQPQALLSTAAVWRDVQLPPAHSAWVPPTNPELWRSQGLGVTNSAAAELQLLLMLWGWAIRRAPAAGLQHHASGDVLLLLLEAAWLLEVCPAAASHQKRGLCLWSTPAHMLRLLAQPVLPLEETVEDKRPFYEREVEEALQMRKDTQEAPSRTAAAAAAADSASQQQGQQDAPSSADQEQQQQQRHELLRLLQHPGLAGCLVQLPLQLLQALQPLYDAQLKKAAVQFSRLDDTVRRLMEMPVLLLQMQDGLNAAAAGGDQLQQQQQQQQGEAGQRQQLQQEASPGEHSWQPARKPCMCNDCDCSSSTPACDRRLLFMPC